MKPNIGVLNALVRITCGFTMVAWATAKMVKRPWRDSYLIPAILGGMKIGEGITRFCPLTYLVEKQAQNNKNPYFNKEQTEQEHEATPFNPLNKI
ncbi:YgaP family membrane protein [Litchfieldia alkalitelluris]|uniref:YgaP family membrane protein n=1 Tax=Litchfieldia alkalitelluris TaxID=304268 RepID=UPI000997E1BA|nr:DUF2892 domain-containing protein [Litchfieldia alkalitelluris]